MDAFVTLLAVVRFFRELNIVLDEALIDDFRARERTHIHLVDTGRAGLVKAVVDRFHDPGCLGVGRDVEG